MDENDNINFFFKLYLSYINLTLLTIMMTNDITYSHKLKNTQKLIENKWFKNLLLDEIVIKMNLT